MAIFDSVLEGKPILILTVIMALLAGIVMWMLVCIECVHHYGDIDLYNIETDYQTLL